MGLSARTRRGGRALLAATALLAAEARADGLTVTADALFSTGTTRVQDALGRVSVLDSMSVPQQYRLSLDKELYPYLRVNALGAYEWTPGWSTFDGIQSRFDVQRWNLFASTVLGPPILNATPYYSRRQEWASTGFGGVTTYAPSLINQGWGLMVAWNPSDFPVLGARYDHSQVFDSQRSIRDTVSDEVYLNLGYGGVENLVLRYNLRWGQATDNLTGVKSRDLSQTAQVGWSGSFWERRVTTGATYNLGLRTSEVVSTGNGDVSIQQFPIAGLSLVETFPSIPSQNTLAPNPALIDGNVLSSAGIDIGFAPALSGDQNFRDMGVQFPTVTTEVNVIRLWVDRPLPPGIWSTFSFTAWQSSDNVVWTQVPITAPVTFGVFENYFEIPISRTAARYLKVVTKPLSPGVTTDVQFADVFVTEIQPWLVVPAGQVPPKSTQASGNLNGFLRVLLFRDWNVNYTLAFSAAHANDFVPQDWSVQNAVSAAKAVGRNVTLAARVERTDAGRTDGGHESQNRWTAQVGWDPLQAFGGSIAYTGQVTQLGPEQIFTNAVTIVGRLDLYQGVNLSGSAGYSWSRDVLGRTANGVNTTVSATVVPFPALVLAGSWSLNTSVLVGTELGTGQQTSSLQGTASFSPVTALFFSAGVTRSTATNTSPQTIANFAAGLSPFTGGQLLLRFGYNETLDSGAEMRNRIFGPSLRWNIRPATFLDLSYTWSDSIQPVLLTQSRNFFARLVVTLN